MHLFTFTIKALTNKVVAAQLAHFTHFIHLKRPLNKNTKNWFSRPIIAYFRSKIFQNVFLEHSAILMTFIKLQFVFKTLVLSIFSGGLRRDLL